MGLLRLAFLGTPEVHHSGRVVTFPTRKALALLAYLAVEGGRHTREKVAALLWPEGDAEQGSVEAAVETATRWLRLDPLDESAHQRLMQLHLAAGDPPAALRAYDA